MKGGEEGKKTGERGKGGVLCGAPPKTEIGLRHCDPKRPGQGGYVPTHGYDTAAGTRLSETTSHRKVPFYLCQ